MILHNGVTASVLVGDCLASLRSIPDNTFNCCVTSPPYFGLRDYGHEGQIGLEDTPDAYVARLVDVFREVRRTLADDGTLWLNIGDSYARDAAKGQHKPGASGKNSRVYDAGGGRASATVDLAGAGLKEKDLIGIPWMLAFALRADGWYLRSEIVWSKPNPMPESVRDRPTKAHEQIFLLTKSPRYYYDHEAVKEPVAESTRARMVAGAPPKMGGTKYGEDESQYSATKSGNDYALTERRNRRSVWTVAPRPYAGAHFAVFPPELIEPCVLAGCPPGGVVLDPFGGSGTTNGVAVAHGRHGFALELNAEYAALMPDRVRSIVSKMGVGK